MQIKKAIILSAGYGKRLNPMTLSKPKSLLEINKKTLLENTIRVLEKFQINEIVINTHYLSDQINKFIKNKKIVIVFQYFRCDRRIVYKKCKKYYRYKYYN